MTPLPSLIRKGGFELMLVLRTGRVAIYRQHQPGGDPDHDTYEVILQQVRNTNHEGEPVKPYETFPSAEAWGKKGWTFTNVDKAFQKLLQLRGRATQKASCRGTVSRRNRRDGRRGLRPSESPRLMLPSKKFARPVGQSHQTPTGGRSKDFLGYTEPWPSTLPK
jgi:hypothetical protein